MKRKQAFTLIELLVVVAIIAILIAILLPSLSRARESTRKSACAANLKSQGQAAAVYAAQNNDYLPMFDTTAGNKPLWLWDQTLEWGNAMLDAQSTLAAGIGSKTGARKQFYCPSDPTQNDDALWNFSDGVNTSPTAAKLRVLGYVWINDRGALGGSLPAASTLQGATTSGSGKRGMPLLDYHKKFTTTPNAGATELALDAMISDWGFSDAKADNFISVQGGWGGRHSTSHMERFGPSGGNVLCCDGHAEWRPFSFATTVRVLAGKYFWFPAPAR